MPFIYIKEEEIEGTYGVINDMCREDKKDAVIEIAHDLGQCLLDVASEYELNLDELICTTYVLCDVLEIAVDKYEEIVKDMKRYVS